MTMGSVMSMVLSYGKERKENILWQIHMIFFIIAKPLTKILG